MRTKARPTSKRLPSPPRSKTLARTSELCSTESKTDQPMLTQTSWKATSKGGSWRPGRRVLRLRSTKRWRPRARLGASGPKRGPCWPKSTSNHIGTRPRTSLRLLSLASSIAECPWAWLERMKRYSGFTEKRINTSLRWLVPRTSLSQTSKTSFWIRGFESLMTRRLLGSVWLGMEASSSSNTQHSRRAAMPHLTSSLKSALITLLTDSQTRCHKRI